MRARVRRRTGPLAELDAHLPGEQSALAPLAGVPSGCAGFTPRVAAYPPRPRRYEEKDLRNLSAFSYSPHSSSLQIRMAVPESMPASGARGGLIGREPACGGAAIAVYADGPGTRSGYLGELRHPEPRPKSVLWFSRFPCLIMFVLGWTDRSDHGRKFAF